MKGILFCIGIFNFVISAKGQHLNLNDVRKDFNKGVKNQELCERHLEVLEKHAQSPLEKGYEAAFHMFMAKHTGNPIKKMSYFNGGKRLLEKQIKSDPNNVELRFIRLCIQYYIPTYLGYRDNIDQDKDFLVGNLYKLDDEKTKDLLFNYLKGAKMYTEQELVQLGR
ncbi:hypothetical protein [Sphingobacterium faecale]|uniref:Sel1 repeat family protein n=1 Tax=Sphingobacterium faecale TaxID=2803775 RepID=A0ABS1QZ25_9SPHI|nr:hypothetical protein [Sphingobacterium faecale]MBL1407687.1 hypothetical protein [Sphingobacterium faecale]